VHFRRIDTVETKGALPAGIFIPHMTSLGSLLARESATLRAAVSLHRIAVSSAPEFIRRDRRLREAPGSSPTDEDRVDVP